MKEPCSVRATSKIERELGKERVQVDIETDEQYNWASKMLNWVETNKLCNKLHMEYAKQDMDCGLFLDLENG